MSCLSFYLLALSILLFGHLFITNNPREGVTLGCGNARLECVNTLFFSLTIHHHVCIMVLPLHNARVYQSYSMNGYVICNMCNTCLVSFSFSYSALPHLGDVFLKRSCRNLLHKKLTGWTIEKHLALVSPRLNYNWTLFQHICCKLSSS